MPIIFVKMCCTQQTCAARYWLAIVKYTFRRSLDSVKLNVTSNVSNAKFPSTTFSHGFKTTFRYLISRLNAANTERLLQVALYLDDIRTCDIWWEGPTFAIQPFPYHRLLAGPVPPP